MAEKTFHLSLKVEPDASVQAVEQGIGQALDDLHRRALAWAYAQLDVAQRDRSAREAGLVLERERMGGGRRDRQDVRL